MHWMASTRDNREGLVLRVEFTYVELNNRLNIVNEESQTGMAPGREPCACARVLGYTHVYEATSWSGVSLPTSIC